MAKGFSIVIERRAVGGTRENVTEQPGGLFVRLRGQLGQLFGWFAVKELVNPPPKFTG